MFVLSLYDFSYNTYKYGGKYKYPTLRNGDVNYGMSAVYHY